MEEDDRTEQFVYNIKINLKQQISCIHFVLKKERNL